MNDNPLAVLQALNMLDNLAQSMQTIVSAPEIHNHQSLRVVVS